MSRDESDAYETIAKDIENGLGLLSVREAIIDMTKKRIDDSTTTKSEKKRLRIRLNKIQVQVHRLGDEE